MGWVDGPFVALLVELVEVQAVSCPATSSRQMATAENGFHRCRMP